MSPLHFDEFRTGRIFKAAGFRGAEYVIGIAEYKNRTKYFNIKNTISGESFALSLSSIRSLAVSIRDAEQAIWGLDATIRDATPAAAAQGDG